MALTATCPNCATVYRLEDRYAGKRVKCDKCGEPFTAAAADPGDPADPLGVTAATPPPLPVASVVPEARPAAPAAEDADRPRRPRASQEDDDLDEDRPRRRRRFAEDDEDDYPRRRPRRRVEPQSGIGLPLVIVGVVLGVFVLCGGGAGIFFFLVGRAVHDVRNQAVAVMQQAQQQHVLLGPNARVDLPGPGTEVVLAADGSFTHAGNLANGDPLVVGKHAKLYTLSMEKGKTYQIDLISQEFDSYLLLLSADGHVLFQDDDGAGNLNARLFYAATETGPYKIVATSLAPGMQGNFTLQVRRDPPPPVAAAVPPPMQFPPGQPRPNRPIITRPLMQLPPLKGPGVHVTLGADGAYRHDGLLEANGPRLPGNKNYALYSLPMEKGKTYQIELTSNQFDSYLYLVDPMNRTVAQDDDGAGNLNARIAYTAPRPGTYKIVATTLAGIAEGEFTLSVRR